MILFDLKVGELNWTELHRVDPVTRRAIGRARQRHEVDWLQGCSARTAALHLSSVRLLCEHGLSDVRRRCHQLCRCSSDRQQWSWRYIGEQDHLQCSGRCRPIVERSKQEDFDWCEAWESFIALLSFAILICLSLNSYPCPCCFARSVFTSLCASQSTPKLNTRNCSQYVP